MIEDGARRGKMFDDDYKSMNLISFFVSIYFVFLVVRFMNTKVFFVANYT